MNDCIEFKDINCVLMLADVHYGLKTNMTNNSIKYVEWLDNMNSYFTEFFIPLVESYRNKLYKPMLIVAGDFFENKYSLRVDVMNSTKNIVRSLANIMPVVFIVGNHDTLYTDNNRVNSLRVFEDMKNVYVVDSVQDIKVCGRRFTLMAWNENSSEINKAIKSSNSDYIILHADINGLLYPSKIKVSDKVETKGFKGTHIYAGHIHIRQEKGKVTYLGSPYEMDKNDMGNTKGVYALRFEHIAEDDSYDVFEDFTENTYSPRFLNLDAAKVFESVDKGGDVSSIIGKNYVNLSYKTADYPRLSKFLDDVVNEGIAKGIEFTEIREEAKVEVNEEALNMSIDDAVYDCISKLDISDEEKTFLSEKHKSYTKAL